MLLQCSFFRLKELIIASEKWFNYVFTFFFFFINAKNLGLSDDAKRRKNEDDLTLSDAFWWWEMNWFKFPRFRMTPLTDVHFRWLNSKSSLKMLLNFSMIILIVSAVFTFGAEERRTSLKYSYGGSLKGTYRSKTSYSYKQETSCPNMLRLHN